MWQYPWKRTLPLDRHFRAESLSTIVEIDLGEWDCPQNPDYLNLPSLYLPCLQHLTLRLGSTLKDLTSVIQMLERSSCHLLSVALFNAIFLDIAIKRLLSLSLSLSLSHTRIPQGNCPTRSSHGAAVRRILFLPFITNTAR